MALWCLKVLELDAMIDAQGLNPDIIIPVFTDSRKAVMEPDDAAEFLRNRGSESMRGSDTRHAHPAQNDDRRARIP